VIAARLRLVPRFRQLLYVPRPGLGRPLWVDAPAFDLANHVRVVPVPAPGDEAALLRAAEQVAAGPPGPVPAAVADVAAARAAGGPGLAPHFFRVARLE
jgi:hypothetical protein